MDQPPAVALTAFADTWLRAIETEIGAALCAIGAGRTLTFDLNPSLGKIKFAFFIKLKTYLCSPPPYYSQCYSMPKSLPLFCFKPVNWQLDLFLTEPFPHMTLDPCWQGTKTALQTKISPGPESGELCSCIHIQHKQTIAHSWEFI